MNIQDFKIGDIAVFKDGTEAVIVHKKYRDTREWMLWFDREIRGVFAGKKDNNWLYREDGKYETFRSDGNDIVKIVRT